VPSGVSRIASSTSAAPTADGGAVGEPHVWRWRPPPLLPRPKTGSADAGLGGGGGLDDGLDDEVGVPALHGRRLRRRRLGVGVVIKFFVISAFALPGVSVS